MTNDKKSNIHVIHLFKSYAPETFGGIETVIKTICLFLKEKKISFDVHVLAKNTQKKTTYIDGTPVTKSKRLGYIATTPFSLSAFYDFCRVIKQKSIIHVHSPYPLGELLCVLFARNHKVIVTYHSDIVNYEFLYLFYKPFQHYFLSKADVIIATSEKYKESSHVLRKFASKVHVIPIGIQDESQKKGSDKVSRKIKELIQSEYILFQGGLRKYKGLTVLLESAKTTRGHIVISGGGPLLSTLQKIIKSQSIKNVTLLDAVSDTEKNLLLSNCLALVLPSTMRSEAFGIVLLEAASRSKALISTSLDTGTDVINQHLKTGLVVPKESPEELSYAMNKLIEDPALRAEMGKQARNLYLEHYTAQHMAEQYKSYYEALQQQHN